jgi:hypothetical protein
VSRRRQADASGCSGDGIVDGAGADPERAWILAQQNLDNRQTDRAVALAIKVAEATRRHREACALVARRRARPNQIAPDACPENT